MLVHAVITNRLDNCNSLSIYSTKANLYKLQKEQNTAARLVVKGKKRKPITRDIEGFALAKSGTKYCLVQSYK